MKSSYESYRGKEKVSANGGEGGILTGNPAVLRGTVPLAISQGFGDCHGLTASQ